MRVRRAGQRYFVDVTISVPRTASLEQAHAASDAVESTIGRIVPADVMVHVEPRARSNEHLFETIRAIAQRRGLAVHELSAHQLDGRLFVELHLEVDEKASLREAHRRATELESDILSAADAARARQHPYRASGRAHPRSRGDEGAFAYRCRISSTRCRAEYRELTNCHEVHVRTVEHKILVSCHCAMDGGLPITQVHDITAKLEDRVKERFPANLSPDDSPRAGRRELMSALETPARPARALPGNIPARSAARAPHRQTRRNRSCAPE